MFKGVNPQLDSYSAFYDNQKLSKTILDELIRKEGVSDLYICGIATDVCVGRFHVKQKSVPVNMEIKRRLKKIVLHFQVLKITKSYFKKDYLSYELLKMWSAFYISSKLKTILNIWKYSLLFKKLESGQIY